jgi:sterol desaturase/sphingolipid hydroxylase (fatty acid hydroxylase superfamily)
MVYSAANYWIVLVGDVLGALAFLVLGARWFSGSWIVAAILVVAGFNAWGLLEYTLHRWILHGRYSMAKRGHARHHADDTALISTPMLIIMSGACLICWLLSLVLPVGVACVLVFGLYAGYNWYAIVHHLQHHRAKDLWGIRYFRHLEHRHRTHHHRVVVNYGISTAVWDRLFGTYQPPTIDSGPNRGLSRTTRS